MLDDAMHNGMRDQIVNEEEYDKSFCASSMRPMNPDDEELVTCDGNNYPSLEQTIESFNSDDVNDATEEDQSGPIYNYEWVDEVMQALNVSPDISNAFHVSLNNCFEIIKKLIINYFFRKLPQILIIKI